ncbi:hypothetical protein EV360DRAFT_89890 [Lentinula raphanica]|nr:hypothetical protein EV360DRAFT_89890 [Lentinula raphanica]
MPPRTQAALGTRKTRSNNVPDTEQTSLSSMVQPAKRNKRIADTSEGKGKGKGKGRGVQKGKGKAKGKGKGEEPSDGEIETEKSSEDESPQAAKSTTGPPKNSATAVEASDLEVEDSASRSPSQLPLPTPSAKKPQTLARQDISSTMAPPARTPVSSRNTNLEAFRVLQAFMANEHTYPSAELAIQHIFGDAYRASQWEPWLSRITSIEPDDAVSFQSVSGELDAEISHLEQQEKVNHEANEDEAQSGGRGAVNDTKDVSLGASLPEDDQVESLCADAMLCDPDRACQVLGGFRDYLQDAVTKNCGQSIDFKKFNVWKLAKAYAPSEYQLARQSALVEWQDIVNEHMAACLKGKDEDGDSEGGKSQGRESGGKGCDDDDDDDDDDEDDEDEDEDDDDNTNNNKNKRKRHDNKRRNKRRNTKAKAKSGAAPPLTQVKAVTLFSQFNEEEEFEDDDEEDDDEEDDEEEDEDEKAFAVPKSHVRGLTKEVRAELDQWHVEYKEGIKKIAAKAGVDMHACFTYLNQQLHPPRAINRFNAFKAHYAEYGTVKKSSTQSLSDYNKLLREEYWKTLESRLSVGELQDPKARSRAMKPEVDWYREQVKNYIETAKESGKIKGTVKAMIRPVLTLAEKLYETSGYHMLGWLINTSGDKFGRSVSAFFAGDHIAKVAKERFGSKMESQVADMEMMFKMLELENRHVDAAVAKLHSECTAGPKESRRDVERRLTNTFFQHDIDQFLGEESNIKLNTFIDAAMKQHIRLTNWPIAFFPKANIDTYKQISAKDIKTIFIPRKAHFDHLYAIQTKSVDPDEDIVLDSVTTIIFGAPSEPHSAIGLRDFLNLSSHS